jgi:transcriptional regulator with XRE-family HTH domain
VESHISKTLAFQIRSLRDKEGWSQQRLAELVGSNQNAIYRAENPNYGKQTITTLKKIAAAFDVALVVRFVPFSELLDWVSGTPHVNDGLNSKALDVPNFDAEEKTATFDDRTKEARESENDAVASQTGLSLKDLATGNIALEAYRHLAEVNAQIQKHAIETVLKYTQENRTSLTTLQELAGVGHPDIPAQKLTRESGSGIHLAVDNAKRQGASTNLSPKAPGTATELLGGDYLLKPA